MDEKIIITFKPTGENIHLRQMSIYEVIKYTFQDDVPEKITTNHVIASVLQDISDYKVYPSDNIRSVNGPYIIGYLEFGVDKLDIEVDPYMKFDDMRILSENVEIVIESKNPFDFI